MNQLHSLLHLLQGKKEEQEKQILLLVHPTLDEYFQTLESIYEFLEYKPPKHLKNTTLHEGVLNYTYVKPDSEGEPIQGFVEIYTIYDPNNDTVLQKQLIGVLKHYASTINVLIYVNCVKDKITELMNSFNIDNETSTDQFINNELFPYIHERIDPFFATETENSNDFYNFQWKSCNVILTNVSTWQYTASTIPIVDFVQQFLRSLLYHFATQEHLARTGNLLYFPFELTDNSSKVMIFLHEIFPKYSGRSLSLFAEPTPTSRLEEKIIKYNDLYINANQDTPRNISLLDEGFHWSKWLSCWNNNGEKSETLGQQVQKEKCETTPSIM